MSNEQRKSLNTIDARSTIETDPLRNFRFRVNFSKVGSNGVFDSSIVNFSGGFQTVSGLSITTSAIAYREGGYNTTAHMIPGMTTFSPITLTRGALFGNDSAITWMRGLFAASSAEGLQVSDSGNASFRVNMTIQLMDHPQADTSGNKPRMGFYVHNAWITSLNYTSLDAQTGTLMIETMELAHEGLSVAMLNTDGTAYNGSVKPNGFI
jgi:phage tail-like protein